MASTTLRDGSSAAFACANYSPPLGSPGRILLCAAEIIKRRINGLHQNTQIGSMDITDTWEPLEEGLNRLETVRHVSVITITLSTVDIDVTLPGYQPPLPEDQVKPLQDAAIPRRPRIPVAGRGRYAPRSTSTSPLTKA